MATRQRTNGAAYSCPDCSGSITFEHRSWECADCGFAPRHGAD